ncbi:hypothetical protein [Aquisphaera insulae]|uniref:hypothetical protein n=1 Tax=Aquisphaera insulae TaxID=2712864 RepID=UPI0013EB8609|nr:hypothetical protein [Aquisphaera insulae]
MVIHLDPDLEAALTDSARRLGIPPEALARDVLRARFLGGAAAAIHPGDERERRLIRAASDCWVSLPHSALSSEGLYEASGGEVILADGAAPRARIVPCEPPRTRVEGLHAGAFQAAPDLDDPLPDEFWIGRP